MIDKSKKYQTRDGRKVEILATDMGGKYPVLARFPRNDDPARWASNQFTATGYCYDGGDVSSLDLIEVKETARIERWINIYRRPNGELYPGSIHPDADAVKKARQGETAWFATKRLVIEATEGDEQ